jgi:hypothetical protein
MNFKPTSFSWTFLMAYSNISQGCKVASAWSWKFTCSSEVKSEWGYISTTYTPSQHGASLRAGHVFIGRCLIKQRDNFTITWRDQARPILQCCQVAIYKAPVNDYEKYTTTTTTTNNNNNYKIPVCLSFFEVRGDFPPPQRYFVATALIILPEVKYEFIWGVFNIQHYSEFRSSRVQVIK